MFDVDFSALWKWVQDGGYMRAACKVIFQKVTALAAAVLMGCLTTCSSEVKSDAQRAQVKISLKHSAIGNAVLEHSYTCPKILEGVNSEFEQGVNPDFETLVFSNGVQAVVIFTPELPGLYCKKGSYKSDDETHTPFSTYLIDEVVDEARIQPLVFGGQNPSDVQKSTSAELVIEKGPGSTDQSGHKDWTISTSIRSPNFGYQAIAYFYAALRPIGNNLGPVDKLIGPEACGSDVYEAEIAC